MKNGLTVSLIFEASSLNYGEGMGNITTLKHITREGGDSIRMSLDRLCGIISLNRWDATTRR